ncbi:MAG TPA: tRNA guanosine(34) transglycosylase Tgt [Patescibacteria group bacterium]
MPKNLQFTVLHRDSSTKARVGKLVTSHGEIDTPTFTPVGTQATVKSLSAQDLDEIGVQLLFGNTYHLHLRPGEEVVQNGGGLASFMGWKKSTITDSGGFQVFSLGRKSTWGTAKEIKKDAEDEPSLVKISDEKVRFRSHLDGSFHTFTPEKSIEIQHALGADLILAFDHCPPYPSTHEEAKRSMIRTHKWLERCIAYHNKHNTKGQALLGIVQGSVFEDLRKESAEFVAKQDIDALAIGGVAVGESKDLMRKALLNTMPYLPEDKYKHLLGIGEVDDIFDIVAEGIDSFDCVIPTRFGRYGIVFASPPVGNIKNKFRIDLNRQIYAKDYSPMTDNCACKSCTNYTKAYVHHLFKANELLAYRLASYHNVYFLTNLVKQIREAILTGTFSQLRSAWL